MNHTHTTNFLLWVNFLFFEFVSVQGKTEKSGHIKSFAIYVVLLASCNGIVTVRMRLCYYGLWTVSLLFDCF